jgi:hypothetical protein
LERIARLKKSEAVFLTTALILAAVLGGLLGEVLGSFLPQGSVKTLFERSVEFGFNALHLDLYTINLTFGLMIKLNFVSVLMVLVVIVYYRWWYI